VLEHKKIEESVPLFMRISEQKEEDGGGGKRQPKKCVNEQHTMAKTYKKEEIAHTHTLVKKQPESEAMNSCLILFCIFVQKNESTHTDTHTCGFPVSVLV